MILLDAWSSAPVGQQPNSALPLSARSGNRTFRVAALLGATWLAGYALATALTAPATSARQFVGDVVYLVPIATACALSFGALRRVRGRRRSMWLLLVFSNALWLAGEITWGLYAYGWHRPAPFPSVADAFYLSSYLLVPLALLLGFAGASGRRKIRALLDSAVAAMGVGALGWQLLIAPQFDYGWSLATATGIAYPLIGVVILVTLLAVGVGGHRHLPVSLWLVGAAFAASAVTDAAYTYLASLHSYVDGDWLNVGWQVEAVLLCLAALAARRDNERELEVDPIGHDVAVPPVLAGVVCAVAAVGDLAVEHGVSPLILSCAAIVLLGLIGRFMMSVSDQRQVSVQLDLALREQQRLAVTDGLTGLYNRRFFEEVLQLEVDRALRSSTPVALIVADLDHFKSVNDRHGHQDGDAVLVAAAKRLRGALRDHDVLARYGGEEFVAILPGADAEVALEIAERCRQAVGDAPIRVHDGYHVEVTCSFGTAAVPDDAKTADQVISAADRALYVAKEAGRNRVVAANARAEAPPVDTGSLTALVHLADVVDARMGPGEHSAAMAVWAGILADALGLDPTQRSRAITAARLHDIGKITISDQLLSKPGALTAAEWAIMRTHPDEGAQLLQDIPGYEHVAAIIRGHHERMDGRGYPDGIPAGELPVETRLVSVLNTWAAMLSDRSYAAARSTEDACRELRSARGSQLDPDIVDVFLTLHAGGLIQPPAKRTLDPSVRTG
ncbi:MAG TPA: diguanylate cyclase [Jatrophihabitans sp.]|jgi:diguanylate cyclase (GGDEF)-like protein|nr:diguanylate cyclase [Jatrophihabitans sp.]